MTNRTALGLVSACTLAWSTMTPTPSWAERGAPAERLAVNTILDEIIVTARKREESLQDTPVSVTALGGDQLSQLGIEDISRIDDFTPNFQFSQSAPGAGTRLAFQSTIRGIGSQGFSITFDPGVGIYIDGVYQARPTAIAVDTLGVERVEVLRGPQGTLFGKNTSGGALVVTTRAPSNEAAFEGAVTFGRFDRADVELYANGPLVEDRLFANASVSWRNADGYGTLASTGEELADTDRISGRVALRWLPTETLDLTLRADVAHVDEAQGIVKNLTNFVGSSPDQPGFALGFYNSLVPVFNPSVAPVPNGPGPQPDARYLSFGNYVGRDEADQWGVQLNADWELTADITLRSITGYRDLELSFNAEADGLPNRLIESSESFQQTQFSQEFNLLGTMMDGRLSWVVGAFYFHEKAASQSPARFLPELYETVAGLPAALIPVALLGPDGMPIPGGVPTCPGPTPPNLCAGGPGNPLNAQFDFSFDHDLRQTTDSYAAFAQASYEVLPALTLTGGMRYTRDEKDYRIAAQRILSGLPLVFDPADPSRPLRLKDAWDSFTPYASASFAFARNSILYASYSRGFKSGGFNPRAQSLDEALVSFAPEKVTAYELGVKTELLDRKLRANLALFHSDYDDLQLATSTIGSNGAPIQRVENAGSARARGAELELTALPIEPLLLAVGVGYLDSKIKEVAPGAAAKLGGRLVRAPRWSLSALAQYTLPISVDDTLIVSADYSYRSDFFNDTQNSPQARVSGYGLLNGQLRYVHDEGRWSIAVFGTNLTDRRYFETKDFASGAGLLTGQPGRPREWGVRLGAQF